MNITINDTTDKMAQEINFDDQMNAQNIRPRHPLAQILLDHKERVMAEILIDPWLLTEDEHIFDESLHKCISYMQDDELCWKNTLGDGDSDLYSWRVRWDYDEVYNGDWIYECKRRLGVYHDPTQPLVEFEYTPDADVEQRRQEWRVQWRRLTGDIL